MLRSPRMAELTADSMVQALSLPTGRFARLIQDHASVREAAWQAAGAQLAAQHDHILGEHRQLAPLNIFFRRAARGGGVRAFVITSLASERANERNGLCSWGRTAL